MKTKVRISKDRVVTINIAPNWLMLLGSILVLLKLTGYTQVATLSWWIVLLPFYAGLAIVSVIFLGAAAILALVFVGAIIIDQYNSWQRRRTYRK